MTYGNGLHIIITLTREVFDLKFTKSQLLRAPNQQVELQENIEFEASTFAKFERIRGLKDVQLVGKGYFDVRLDLFSLSCTISGVMVVPCAVSLEDVDYPFTTEMNVTYSFHKLTDDQGDMVVTKGDVVEVLPEVFAAILMEVPLKVVKPGVVYPKSDHWEVISEAEYQRQKSKELDPRLAKLKEFVSNDE